MAIAQTKYESISAPEIRTLSEKQKAIGFPIVFLTVCLNEFFMPNLVVSEPIYWWGIHLKLTCFGESGKTFPFCQLPHLNNCTPSTVNSLQSQCLFSRITQFCQMRMCFHFFNHLFFIPIFLHSFYMCQWECGNTPLMDAIPFQS